MAVTRIRYSTKMNQTVKKATKAPTTSWYSARIPALAMQHTGSRAKIRQIVQLRTVTATSLWSRFRQLTKNRQVAPGSKFRTVPQVRAPLLGANLGSQTCGGR